MMNSEFSLPPVSAGAAGVEQQKAPVKRAGTAAPGSGKAMPANAESSPDPQQILQAGSKYFQQRQQHLSFSVDESSGSMVVSVIDSKTSEVIRQIPNEDMLSISRKMRQVIEENSTAGSALLIEKSA